MQLISQPKPLGKGYFLGGGISGQQWVWVTGSSNSMENDHETFNLFVWNHLKGNPFPKASWV